jgi:hypothetical protein
MTAELVTRVMLLYEQSRRRTYIAVLDTTQPGTLLLDRAHRRSEITVVRLLPPRLIAPSHPAGLEDPRR